MFKSSKCNLQQDKQPKIIPPISFRSIFSLRRNTEPWKWQHGCNIEFMWDCTKIQRCLSEPISTKDLWCLIQSTCWLPLKTVCKRSYKKRFCFEGKRMSLRRNFSTKWTFVEIFLYYKSTDHLPFTLKHHFYTHLKLYRTGVFCLHSFVTIVNNKQWFNRAFTVGRCINSKCQVFIKTLFFFFFYPDNNQHLC